MSNDDETAAPSQAALRACAEWLSYCLRMGWKKGQLDGLQALWWKYHDRNGRLCNGE